MILDTTKKIIIRVSIIAILFFIIIFGVLVPTLLHIKKTSQESYKLRLLLEENYQQSLNSRITRKKLEEIRGAVSNFDNFIFKSGDELKLITFLESTAAKHNVTQSINSSNLDKIGPSHIAAISLNLKGDYHNILEYIADLETANYFINIEQLQLTPEFTKEGEPSSIVNLNIATETYVSE
jgi:Tfp pilus assembly protein PilO